MGRFAGIGGGLLAVSTLIVAGFLLRAPQDDPPAASVELPDPAPEREALAVLQGIEPDPFARQPAATASADKSAADGTGEAGNKGSSFLPIDLVHRRQRLGALVDAFHETPHNQNARSLAELSVITIVEATGKADSYASRVGSVPRSLPDRWVFNLEVSDLEGDRAYVVFDDEFPVLARLWESVVQGNQSAVLDLPTAQQVLDLAEAADEAMDALASAVPEARRGRR